MRGHANWDFKTHEYYDNGHAADVIPPFTYTDKDGDHTFPGQNWNDNWEVDDDGKPAVTGGCAVHIQVDKTVLLWGKAAQVRAELFYGKVHGAPV